MNISLTPLYNTAFHSFRDGIVNSLNTQRKRVIAIAFVIFSCIVASIAIYRCCFRARVRDPEQRAILQNWMALKEAPERLKNDPKFVKLVVEKNGLALEFASADLKNDPDIVKAAVQKNGMTLREASGLLQDNPKL